MTHLLKLAKQLDFQSETEYFDYCIDSYINGNKDQCKNLFKKMKKEDRKRLLNYISQEMIQPSHMFNFYLNLL